MTFPPWSSYPKGLVSGSQVLPGPSDYTSTVEPLLTEVYRGAGTEAG